MSSPSSLLLYLLLEQGSLQHGSDVLFRPLCGDDGRLQPPLVSELRAERGDRRVLRGEKVEERAPATVDVSLNIDFATPESDVFTLQVPPEHFITRGLSAESCFG